MALHAVAGSGLEAVRLPPISQVHSWIWMPSRACLQTAGYEMAASGGRALLEKQALQSDTPYGRDVTSRANTQKMK